jgi:CHAT domain
VVRSSLAILLIFATGTAIVYWISQHTKPGERDSNAVTTALIAAISIGAMYYFAARRAPATSTGPAWKFYGARVAPILIAGPIGAWLIQRRTGPHAFPYWVEGLATGSMIGLVAGYFIDLLERPFAGRPRAIASLTLIAVVILPGLRLVAFDRMSVPGIFSASIAALAGVMAGATLGVVLVKRPDHILIEAPDAPTPSRHTVLIVIANPAGDALQPLATDLEARSVCDAIRNGTYRECFDVRICLAARKSDLDRELRQRQPTIVHVICHGTQDGLWLHGANDLQEIIGRDALTEVLKLQGTSVHVLIFNACCTDTLAEHLVASTTSIRFAVGMTGRIDDRSARAFTDGFYCTLANGSTVDEAYQAGRTSILGLQLPDSDAPRAAGKGDFLLVPLP